MLDCRTKEVCAQASPQPARSLIALLVLWTSVTLFAQEPVSTGLPDTRQLAASLAEPASRSDTLLTLLATANLLAYADDPTETDIGPLADRFRADRAWLDQLSARYSRLPVRGGHLDPAVWFIARELDQHGLKHTADISISGLPAPILMRVLFDRSDARLAAAVLPEALQSVESLSTTLWSELLDRVRLNEHLVALVQQLNDAWFEPWVAAEPPAPASTDDSVPVVQRAVESLQILMANSALPQAPDPMRLKRLRFGLYSALPALSQDGKRQAAHLLRLASAIDGLQDAEYLAFAESLLWVLSDMLLAAEIRAAGEAPTDEDAPEAGPGQPAEAGGNPRAGTPGSSQLADSLSEWLPTLSNSYGREFSQVDPRINAVLAAAFEAAQYLREYPRDRDRLESLRRGVADAVVQIVLSIDGMDVYFNQPVRRPIAQEIDICTSIFAGSAEPGQPPIGREQFDGCLESMVELADTAARRGELSGDPGGPFGLDELRREFMLPPAQRINYIIGLLHEEYATGCEAPETLLPNPIEWSSLATLFVWIARQSPVYFQTPTGEELTNRMRQQGLELQAAMARQLDCVSGAGTGVNDPVFRALGQYRRSLDQLVGGIRAAEVEFRSAELKDGADVVLEGDANQSTAFRSEALMIGPCDPGRVCGMSASLETTRALIGQFPDPYLIADQTRLGEIEICYDNMRWVDRRAEPVRREDPRVANYYGRLSFDLIGRYHEQGEAWNVFGSRFVSPDEYHYLFAAATDEVLEDSCPTEWIGQKIVTDMPEKGFRLVPDRLTYLAASRSQPAQVIEANWSRGAEWRDWFVTGLGVQPFDFPPDPAIVDRVNQHLRGLYQAEQAFLYGALLQPPARGSNREYGFLFEQLADVTTRKAVVSAHVALFYPSLMLDSDIIRSLLEGYDALLDREVLRRFRESNVAVESIPATGIARLERFMSAWARQPDVVRRSGYAHNGVAHALARLGELYAEFFEGSVTGVRRPGGPRL